jgi:hypothetical protein
MNLHSVSNVGLPDVPVPAVPGSHPEESQSFDEILKAADQEHSCPQTPAESVSASWFSPFVPVVPISPLLANEPRPPPARSATAAYEQQANRLSDPVPMSDFEKYQDDQLLRNPGGDHYYLEQKEVLAHPQDQESLFGRIGKDLSDSLGNLKDFFGNFFLGTRILYRDENNQIHEGQQRGLIAAVGDFFKHLGSALSFGLWHPDEEKAPEGFMNRLAYSASKFKDALIGDLIEGIPSSLNHMGQNLLLAGWNLIEVLPDATLGAFETGQKLTTTIFDNGQVAVEYLTDIIPSGDAWLRVHAAKLKELQPPVIYNLNMPEHHTGDTRWQYVRNTPLRKAIESIGALLADVVAVGLIGQTGFSSNRHHEVRAVR